ncbi:alpha/beta fold hydrolase [Aquibacillus rhizosphaerae]|uniref:Alpha/beta hydrolase n=1 Tax=Aquibacillus rhizosphaerae TaxID=3051431 RepID=A0ABT7LCV4_9BACI|nr:alpha/beta hydrolase [Aquibacillus sp. LR5S19]MDL4842425.1 alpha/beta hydrolase [Aquibacillus sp. LR5S19]
MILNIQSIGNGEETIVFLHTLLQSGINDFDEQANYFKEKYTVISPDLRGQGKSISNQFDNYIEECASDLYETLIKIDKKNVHLVGCSLGGLASIVFSKRYPEMVKTLTISGVRQAKPLNWEKISEEEKTNAENILNDPQNVSYFDSLHPHNHWKELLESSFDPEWYPFEYTENLKGIDSTILVLVGEEAMDEVKSAIAYKEAHENVKIAILPFAGHMVHHQQPSLYISVLDSFINSLSKSN